MDQRERDLTLILFANRSCPVLVATDVAARGIDIAGLDLVINADISRQPEVHTHRVGRTGRAGQSGLALTLVSTAERHCVKRIDAARGSTAQWREWQDLPAQAPQAGAMRCIEIAAGKRHKLRPADVLGALSQQGGLTREQVGKISVTEFHTYVAVAADVAEAALARMTGGTDSAAIKGRNLKLRLLD